MGRLLFLVLLMCPLFVGGVAVAADLDVCPTCPYTTIQSAIDAAVDGDRVRVTEGTYSENLTINTKSITVSGGWSANFSTRTRDPSLTVVDGGGTGRVLRVSYMSWEADITVQNITLQNGTHDWGGCVRAHTSAEQPMDITFEDVIVQDCECTYGHGGGICILPFGAQIRARFTNVIVRDCATTGSGVGGGMYLGSDDGGDPSIPGDLEVFIVNSLIYDNEADREGGGIDIWAQDDSSTRCVILNSTITGNTSYNTSLGGGGVVVNDDGVSGTTSILGMYNTILYGNTASPGADLTIALGGTQSRSDVYYSDFNGVNHVSGTFNQANNLNTDPLFVGGDDYHLVSTSPCIDAGDNDPPYLLPYTDMDGNRRVVDGDGDLDAVVDMGAYEYDSTAPTPCILHKDGAVWFSDTGWELGTPPYYPGTEYARDLEPHPNGSYGILHKDGALWISTDGWELGTPPYYAGTEYARKAKLLPDGSYSILHTDGAIWNSVSGWDLSTPPYYSGTGYAVDLEYRTADNYLILHQEGAVYDSASGWDMGIPPYYPGTPYAKDLELKAYGSHYVILHQDGALWSTDGGWVLSEPPYYAGTGYAVDMELKADDTNYEILHKEGAIYDSVTGWDLDTPPYYPGSDWALDLEVR